MTSKADRRKEQMETLHQHLADQVEQLRDSDEWARYLKAATSFHNYSMNNLLLILAQCENATQVAGYRAWQKMGRQVRKGERGIQIMAPGRRTYTETTSEGEEEEKERVFFHAIRVFDVEQTEPIEGKEDHTQDPVKHLDEDDFAGLYERTRDYLTDHDVPVEVLPIEGATDGRAIKDKETGKIRVEIDQDSAPAHAALTLLHEAAHIQLGHLDQDPETRALHRGTREVEAESVAYIVAGTLGMDTSANSVGYIAGWSETDETDLIKTTAQRVLTTAHTIAEALAPADTAHAA